MLKTKRVWLFPALSALLLLALSSIPHFSTDSVSPSISDTFWHVVGYVPLGFLIHFAVANSPGPFVALPTGWSIILGVSYGTFNELYQYFIPGRAVDFTDMAANVAGALAGTACFILFRKFSPARKENPA